MKLEYFVYVIMNKDGLYSTGGMKPKFRKKGKIWNSIGSVRKHLKQFKKRDASIYEDSHVYALHVLMTPMFGSKMDVTEHIEAIRKID